MHVEGLNNTSFIEYQILIEAKRHKYMYFNTKILDNVFKDHTQNAHLKTKDVKYMHLGLKYRVNTNNTIICPQNTH